MTTVTKTTTTIFHNIMRLCTRDGILHSKLSGKLKGMQTLSLTPMKGFTPINFPINIRWPDLLLSFAITLNECKFTSNGQIYFASETQHVTIEININDRFWQYSSYKFLLFNSNFYFDSKENRKVIQIIDSLIYWKLKIWL